MKKGVYSKRIGRRSKGFFSLGLFNKLLFVLIIIGSIYYVTSINDLIVKGFKLQELKETSITLENEHRDYNIRVTSLKSYNNLAKRVEQLDMVKSNEVDYLSKKKGSVAVR
jgi:hypothetical protein